MFLTIQVEESLRVKAGFFNNRDEPYGDEDEKAPIEVVASMKSAGKSV